LNFNFADCTRLIEFAAHKPNFAIKTLGKQILNNKLFYGAVKSFSGGPL